MSTATTLPKTSRPTPSPLSNVLTIRRKGYLQFMTDLWRTQGDLVPINFGPVNLFLVVHPDHVKHISIDNRSNYDKLKTYDTVRKLLLGNGLVSSTGELWRRQRKLMSPFFTPRGIQRFATVMIDEGQAFAQRWEQKAKTGETVDMIDEMMKITASIILKTMFSLDTDVDILHMKDAVETLIQSVSKLQFSLIRLPMWVPTAHHQRYNAARKLVHDYIGGIIARRRAMPESEWPDDLLTQLMSARDEETGERMPDQQVLDESITIFFAGHETTARTMTFTWYALSQMPEVEEQFHAEADSVLGGRIPTVEDLKKMGYTLQVIKETLRLYPAAPVYVRDAVANDEIDGQPIPAGAAMTLMPYLTHRHPDFWPEPERFDPQRWQPEREKAQHPYAYHPFASGQRICIGNNFSLFESHILLAILGQRFAPRMLAGHQPKLEMAGTLISTNGVPMVLRSRQH
jgi:cytochrome P450